MKKKFIIGGAILLIPIAFLSYMGIKSSLTYDYEVDQFLKQSSTIQNKTVRVVGQVMPGAESDVSTYELTFTLIDIQNKDGTLPVAYHGAVPDAFKEGQNVTVEGKYGAAGVFEASSIITKCPSKYVPATATTSTAGK